MSGALPVLAGIVALTGCGTAMAVQARAQGTARRRMDERLRTLKIAGIAPARGREAGNAAPIALPRWMQLMCDQADIAPRTATLVTPFVVAVVAAALAAWWSGLILAAIMLVLPPVLALLGLRFLAQRRINAFIDDLPFFLETVRQALLIGNSLQQALTRATDNATPAMQRYLLPMVRRIQNGAAVGDSLSWLAERLGVVELHMVAAAVQANLRYGGRLSAVLANIVQVLRDGGRVRRELRAATAETRLSAIVLSGLPLLAFLVIGLANASYRNFFLYSPDGHQLLLIAGALQLVGSLWMRRLMRLDY